MPVARILAATAFFAIICMHTPATAFEANFRGSYVCERMATTRDILRVPARFTVNGEIVRFTRPLLNLDGGRVGVEVARGFFDQRGIVRLQSRWSLLGNFAHGEYHGRLTSAGGTLSGTQTWTGPRGGNPVVRVCTVALVRDTAISED